MPAAIAGYDAGALADTVIHLIRHGEVHNPASIRYGRLAGFPLSAHGRDQARAAAAFLRSRSAAAIVSSPLERAVETANVIAEELALGPVTTDARLTEAPTQFDGLPKLAVLWPVMWPRLWNPFRPSWGEPFEQVARRMRAAIAELRAAHAGAEVIAVSHQSPIWITRQSYEAPGPPWQSRIRCIHASVTSLHFAGDRYDRFTYWAP